MTSRVSTLSMENVAVLQLNVPGGFRKTAHDLIASAHFDYIWSGSC